MKTGRATNALAALAALTAIGMTSCRSEEPGVPSSCRQGPDAIRAALRAAPGPVVLSDGARLSECIDDTSDGGDLAAVGTAYLVVAGDLAGVAGQDPDGRAATELGYLMGALERSEEGSQGVGYELGRRIRSELLRVDTRSPAYRRGERAGLETG